MASPAVMVVRISDELTDMRQVNVLFGNVVAQDFVAFAKSIQEGTPQ